MAGWKVPYFATLAMSIHVKTPDGEQQQVVVGLPEIEECGLEAQIDAFLGELAKKGYHVVTEAEYAATALEVLKHRQMSNLTEATLQMSADRAVKSALGEDILKLHKGRAGGDA